MTGFRVAEPPPGETELLLAFPDDPARSVILRWVTDRQQQHAQVEATLRRTILMPLPTHPSCMTLTAELLNTRAQHYLRSVTLAALHRLGGVTEHPFTLPVWVNHPWCEVPAGSS
jgi:hypothetical protein